VREIVSVSLLSPCGDDRASILSIAGLRDGRYLDLPSADPWSLGTLPAVTSRGRTMLLGSFLIYYWLLSHRECLLSGSSSRLEKYDRPVRAISQVLAARSSRCLSPGSTVCWEVVRAIVEDDCSPPRACHSGKGGAGELHCWSRRRHQ